MIQFEVNDMTCGYCVGAITAAVKAAAPEATVAIDSPQHVIRVEGVSNAGAVELAIRKAGYSRPPPKA